MSTNARYRKSTTNPNEQQVVPNDSDGGADKDDGCCSCLKSSKSSSQRKKQPKHTNTGSNSYNSTTNGRQEHTSERQARDPIQKVFVPTIKSSDNSELLRDRQSKIKDETYMEPDPIKVAKDGVEYRYKELSDHEETKTNQGQKSDFQKDGNNNVSHGGTQPGLTKYKGKGNNGTHEGTGFDHTKKTMTSTFDQSVPLPRKEKEKANSSSFEQALPMKEKEKAISSTFEHISPPQRKETEKAISSTFERSDPPPRKEKENNLTKHSYEDPSKHQRKDVHTRQENQKDKSPDLTSSSPQQWKAKQKETNELQGNTNDDNDNNQ